MFLHRDMHKAVVGTILIEPGRRETEHFEYAAWYREHEFKPGLYPVTLHIRRTWNSDTKQDCAEDCTLVADDVPTTIVAAYLGTHFGGVSIGPDKAGPREIGRASSKHLRLAYGYKLEDLEARLDTIPGFTRLP